MNKMTMPNCNSVHKIAYLAGIVLLPLSFSIAAAPIVTTKLNGDFGEISSNIRMAIIGEGINIAHVLPASTMLHRTGPTFGYDDDVYSNAQTYEFCSAKISHKLARQDPDNIVLCPFTISVYSLVTEPGIVRVSYRVPVGKPGSEPVVEEVIELVRRIVENADW